MELTAILCNHVEAQNNLLYVSGGGIDRAFVPANTPGPWGISLGIGINISVPWTQTNQEHVLMVDLVDSDSNPVFVPTGNDSEGPLHAEMRFNVGRPPHLLIGESQSMSLAINMPALPIRRLGTYIFVLLVDGTELRRITFSVIAAPSISLGS